MAAEPRDAERGALTDQVEREVKLGAWPGFALPDLDGVRPDVHVGAATVAELDARYYDTVDLRLIRSAITLRHRAVVGRGEGDEGVEVGAATEAGEWTLKLAEGAEGQGSPVIADEGTLARREITVRGAADEMPAAIAHLVRAHVRTEPLVPVARLRTVRRSHEMITGSTVVGEVDDDEVSVLDGDRVAARFREIEIEIMAEAGHDLLPAVVERLQAAGAGASDPTPKLVRALGPRALAPPDLAPIDIGDHSTMADVVRAAFTNAVRRIVEHDHVVRLDDDIEGVHQMRVGTRRLRSDLRTFRSLLDRAWVQPLRRELGWLADELGAVRDLDVMGLRLRAQAAALSDDDQIPADQFFAVLGGEREKALRALLNTLESERYAALLDRLVEAAHSPGFDSAGALRPARKMLPKLAGKPWRQLEKAVKKLGDEPPAEALHGVRIRAKRARYAADVAVPVIGEPARRYAKAVAGVQEVLGDYNDSVVAEHWLREAAGHLPVTTEQALVIGQLIARQATAAEQLLAAWPKAWSETQKGKVTSWLS